MIEVAKPFTRFARNNGLVDEFQEKNSVDKRLNYEYYLFEKVRGKRTERRNEMKIIKYDNMKIKLPFKLSSTECGELTNEQIKVQYVPRINFI